MGRRPCCEKEALKRGAWTPIEDQTLIDYIKVHGEGRWRNLPKRAGLKRCGKSCRLRWLNYLRLDIKRGNITPDEEELIIRLHKLLGNRWSLIAGRLPGRTDNEIKNYWNTKLGKRLNQDSEVNTATTTSKKSRNNKKSRRQLSNDKTAKPMSTPPTEFNVVRTKPIRCTRSFISEPQHGLEGANNIMTTHCKEYSSSCFSSSTLDMTSEFMGNMEDSRMISELVTSEFSGACDFSYETSGGDNDLSPSSVDILLFCHKSCLKIGLENNHQICFSL